MNIIYEMHLLWLEHFSQKFKTTGNPEGVSFSPLARARVLEISLFAFPFPKITATKKKNAKVGKRVKKSQESRSN